jgi:hypothetical protein
LQAFGSFPFGHNGVQAVISEAPDAGDLVNLAARRGYLMWMFRPVHHGIWADFADDATLCADGSRTPPCPIDSTPPVGRGSAKTVYRFGKPGSFSVAN